MRTIASAVSILSSGLLVLGRSLVPGLAIIAVVASAVVFPINASGAPVLTPQQVQALKGLSDSEKRQLAAQYGVALPRSPSSESRVLSETPLQPRPIAVEQKPEEKESVSQPVDPLIRLR